MKKHLWTICFSAVLIAFTAYIALDTFVISTGYAAAADMNTEMFSALTENTESTVLSEYATQGEDNSSEDSTSSEHNRNHTSKSSEEDLSDSVSIGDSSSAANENTYTTDDCTITLTEYEQYNSKIYVADITLSSVQYLKTAFANDTYGKNITAKTSSIAEAHNAVLAINGDYYGVKESGYVIRNGIIYRDISNGSDVLCIYADGTMEVVSDRDYTADELVSMGVWQAFTFGPALVENSSVTVGVNDEVGKAKASNPRTAIGIIDTNHFLFVVSDGRTTESEGLSLYELATFMQSLGVKTAYNLDGGGSSTMYFNGSVVNNPTSGGSIKERKVSDIVYIG